MSEQGNAQGQPETQPEGTADVQAGVADAEPDETLAPAEDADNPGGVSDEQHVSSATDLPEGAEADPLTDQKPEPVVEQESHDG